MASKGNEERLLAIGKMENIQFIDIMKGTEDNYFYYRVKVKQILIMKEDIHIAYDNMKGMGIYQGKSFIY